MGLRYRIEIDCEDDAFEGDVAAEVARILKEESNRLREVYIKSHHKLGDWAVKPLRDINGNRVGKAEFVNVIEGQTSLTETTASALSAGAGLSATGQLDTPLSL